MTKTDEQHWQEHVERGQRAREEADQNLPDFYELVSDGEVREGDITYSPDFHSWSRADKYQIGGPVGHFYAVARRDELKAARARIAELEEQITALQMGETEAA